MVAEHICFTTISSCILSPATINKNPHYGDAPKYVITSLFCHLNFVH